MGDRAESDAWYGRLTVLLARCVAAAVAAAVMDLAHYRPEHTGPTELCSRLPSCNAGPSRAISSPHVISRFSFVVDPPRTPFFLKEKF